MLIKQLKAAHTLSRNINDSIAIVIALDLIHKDFDTKTSSLLKTCNKIIDRI